MENQKRRLAFGYARLFIASWLFLGGVAIQFLPTPAQAGRDAHWRERQLQTIQPEQRAQWIEDRDAIDCNSQAYQRLFGVLLGGLGFAMALRETAYLTSRYGR